MPEGSNIVSPKSIAEILKPEHIAGALYVSNKAQLLRDLGARAGKALGMSPQAIIDRLLAREHLGSTAVGRGCAIPHTTIPGLADFFGLFARLERPVEFAALDAHPVDLVFMLLSPEAAGKSHLTSLAGICRQLRQVEVADAMRMTRDPKQIYDLLTGQRLP